MKNFMGKEGFYWWQGVVEDRMDPLKIGRCRVRILGVHTDDKSSTGIPTKDLPWAMIMLPVNSEEKIVPPKDGTWVMGFFRDAENCQDPVIIGVIPGIPEEACPNTTLFGDDEKGFFDAGDNLDVRPIDMETGFTSGETTRTNTITRTFDKPMRDDNLYPKHPGEPDTHRLARAESLDKTILQWKVDNRITGVVVNNTRDGDDTSTVSMSTWDEPNPTEVYDALYPFNKVMASESGHIIEIDDTLEHERIHIFHRSGTFDEMQPNGDRVQKTFGNSYRITYLDDHYLCLGTKHETYGGDKRDQFMEQKGEIVGGKRYVYGHDINSEVFKLSNQNYVGTSHYLTVEANDGADDANAMNFLAEKGNIRISSRNEESGEIHIKSDHEVKIDGATQVQTLSLGQINTQAIADQTHMAGGVFKILAGGVMQLDSLIALQLQSHDYASLKSSTTMDIASPTIDIDATTALNIRGQVVAFHAPNGITMTGQGGAVESVGNNIKVNASGNVYINCDPPSEGESPKEPGVVSIPGVPVTPAKLADHANVGDGNIVTPSTLDKG